MCFQDSKILSILSRNKSSILKQSAYSIIRNMNTICMVLHCAKFHCGQFCNKSTRNIAMKNLHFDEIPSKFPFLFFIKLNFYRKIIHCSFYAHRDVRHPLVPSSARKTTTFTCTVTPRFIVKGEVFF